MSPAKCKDGTIRHALAAAMPGRYRGDRAGPVHIVFCGGVEGIQRLDCRARAAHAVYFAAQRAARGADFGGLPAEQQLELLAEIYRDDRRANTDHIGYKLARAGLIAVSGSRGASLGDRDRSRLAGMEHARRPAGRALSGWRWTATSCS